MYAQNEIQGNSRYPGVPYIHFTTHPKFYTGNLKCYQYLKVNMKFLYWKYFQGKRRKNLGLFFFFEGGAIFLKQI